MNIEQARNYLDLRILQRADLTLENPHADPADIADSVAERAILTELHRLNVAVSSQEAELRKLRAARRKGDK